MRRGLCALAVLALAAPLSAAGGAAPSGEGVLAAACQGPGALDLLLMPEEASALDAETNALTVTGAYTATDKRDETKPKPVGLFLHRGEAVSLEFGRMDGVLVVEADGQARIAAAPAAEVAGATHDLTGLEGRRAFVAAARAAGASALQSHLLIRDGALDLRPVDDAPLAIRRILFQTADGALAIWQSGARALTLHAAAEELARLHAPVMAMNLDMGSYDFCERTGAKGPEGKLGASYSCGFLDRSGAERLSNLIRLFPGANCG
ncbi:hypothetical protein P2H44_17125 [Albimonas sp. CAU 1670]|uniref:hypothetical protein n=1 Tax=Albimonas sp. CAU 1670 TaxID=3032599 RepID=UPI0023D9E2BB|nr:hypothetical protein [Albimonas sp. CAU 1670]MDF2234286.1 hypothetical protein [Albimonas sp. CAU 1670]